MKKKIVILTGSNGGIGNAIQNKLLNEGFTVIAIDKKKLKKNAESKFFLQFDIGNLINSSQEQKKLTKKVLELSKGGEIVCLINNAAIQILSNFRNLHENILIESLNINLIAPFILTKLFFKNLKKSKGKVINIGSIHGQQTKKNFLAYSVSKSSLLALNKSLSIEIGQHVSMISISPAAIKTKMLMEGFKEKRTMFNKLKNYHPTKTIGKPEDIAEIVNFLIKNELKFMNGSNIFLDGGISNLLNDPDF